MSNACIRMVAPVLALVAGLWAIPASAWSRTCRWQTGPGITTIPTYVNCDSFGATGYPCDSVRDAIRRMHRPWNEVGGTNIRLGPPSNTTSWSTIPGAMRYAMLGVGSDPNIRAQADASCTGSTTVFFAIWRWDLDRPVRVYGHDMVGAGIHETGHMLGFLHPEDPPGGSCTAVANTTQLAVMHGGGFTEGAARTIFRDDWDGLRTGPCGYTPAIPTGVLNIRRSTNGGESWTLSHLWATGSNLAPTIVWGNPAGGAGFFVEGRVDMNNQVVLWKRAGSWSGPHTESVRAIAGLSGAYGNGRFLVVYPRFDQNGFEGRIRMLRSTDGLNWTATDTPYHTANRPAVAWNASRGRFYIALSEGPVSSATPEATMGRLQIFSTTDGASWSTPIHSVDRHYANAGPAITCPPPGSCWVAFPEATVSSSTISQFVFTTSYTGTILGQGNYYRFLHWDDDTGIRWITSQHDIAAAYDSERADIVYAFREQNALRSAVGVWFDAVDTLPPAGFTTMYSEFNSGGQAQDATHFGVGLTVDTSTSPDTTYMIGHR